MIPLLSILFYPFAIPFCRVTIMFSSLPIQSYLFVIPLSFGSHSCSLHFRYSPTYIHLIFLSVGSLYCSLHFQYSPISICYSFLFGHIHVLFTSNTVLYLCAIPLCHGSYYVLFASFTAITIWSYLFFEV